jgi:glyoxylase-like metal-dependent hydrolase (beta-lactamase superfamily II)
VHNAKRRTGAENLEEHRTPQLVAEDLWMLEMSFEGGLGISLCYLLQDSEGRIHVVDPGEDNPANRRRLADAVQLIAGAGLESIASILITHLHVDHLGMGDWLSGERGIPVQLHHREVESLQDGSVARLYEIDQAELKDRWAVPEQEFAALELDAESKYLKAPLNYTFISDDQVLDVPGRMLRSIHTPGHTLGHLCFAFEDQQVLLAGDQILPNVFPGAGRGGAGEGNPISDFVDSLERLAAFDQWRVGPGHGWFMDSLGERRREIGQRIKGRADKVAQLLADGERRSIWSITRVLWPGERWENLQPAHKKSALLQTEYFVAYVR